MKNIQKILGGVILLIGVYMIIKFSGGTAITPPVISGLAFILIGIQSLLKK